MRHIPEVVCQYDVKFLALSPYCCALISQFRQGCGEQLCQYHTLLVHGILQVFLHARSVNAVGRLGNGSSQYGNPALNSSICIICYHNSRLGQGVSPLAQSVLCGLPVVFWCITLKLPGSAKLFRSLYLRDRPCIQGTGHLAGVVLLKMLRKI